MKKCYECNVEKELIYFNRNKRSKDGYHYTCCDCKKLNYHKTYEKDKINKKDYYNSNKELISEKGKTFYKNNKDKKLEYQIYYYHTHKKEVNKQKKERRDSNPLYKLTVSIRNAISKSLRNKNFSKRSKTYQILGCSFDEFQIYIQSQFENWMEWTNHGVYTGNYNETWQYDHIKPVSLGLNEEEIIKLNHYTNFQPLCSRKNLEKLNHF
jgi:hypothetical protein